MSWPSDELREFGDAIDAGRTSKIKEPEPSAWQEYVHEPTGLRFHGDPDAPTGPLAPGQVMCVDCRLDDRTRAASSPDDQLCHICRSGGDARNGHQFHFQVCVQGSYRVGDGPYQDAPEPEEYEPFTLTVRARNLAAACRKAAETPLAKWKHAGEGEG
jgi:hypothetical protein